MNKFKEFRVYTLIQNTPPLIYDWPIVEETTIEEISETIYLFQREFIKELTPFDEIKNISKNRPDKVLEAVAKFNALIMSKPKLDKASNESIGRDFLSTLLKHVYNKVIEDPIKLNKYTPFSDEVYGEFKFGIISDIIRKVGIGPNDSVVDLGSGVGQVVLQVAAETKCKIAYGVEKRKICCEYAEGMQKDFIHRLDWFGKKCQPFKLINSDFTDDSPQMSTIFDTCNIIIVNNFVFPSSLNLFLKEKFKVLKEGTIIISSISFCPPNFRISDRTANDTASILEVEKHTFEGHGVSWTGGSSDYFVHKITYKNLLNFYNSKTNKSSKQQLQHPHHHQLKLDGNNILTQNILEQTNYNFPPSSPSLPTSPKLLPLNLIGDFKKKLKSLDKNTEKKIIQFTNKQNLNLLKFIEDSRISEIIVDEEGKSMMLQRKILDLEHKLNERCKNIGQLSNKILKLDSRIDPREIGTPVHLCSLLNIIHTNDNLQESIKRKQLIIKCKIQRNDIQQDLKRLIYQLKAAIGK